jgi:hypothetical protein
MSRFEFPNICCRCAADQPRELWNIQSYDQKPGPANSIVSITYTTPVPVCTSCHRSLTLLLAGCWLVALTVGITSGWLMYGWASHRPHAETYPPLLMLGVPVLLGGMIAWGCAWVLKAIFINYDFVHYDPNQATMVFKNKQYQQVFDSLNHEPVGQSWSAG